MYRTAKNLEITEVEVYGCFIFLPLYIIAQNFDSFNFFEMLDTLTNNHELLVSVFFVYKK